jgi:hypothetical protein
MTATTYRGTVDQPCSLELDHVGEDEMADLHEWLSSTLLACGLDGAALDEALAAVLQAVLPILERERAAHGRQGIPPQLRLV